MLGDSISHQSEAEIDDAFADQAEVVAITGRTFEASQSDAAELAATRPGVVVVELGTNDVWSETVLSEIEDEIDEILDSFADACVVMVNVNQETRDARSLNGTIFDNAEAARLNAVIEDRAHVLVDWNAAVNADPRRFLDEGTVHPTPEGRKLLASLMAEAVDDC